jgi:hypothetical protein
VATLLRLRDGTTMTSATRHRSLDRYRALLTGAGFPAPTLDLPTLPTVDLLPPPAEGPAREAPAETRTAPYMISTTHA